MVSDASEAKATIQDKLHCLFLANSGAGLSEDGGNPVKVTWDMSARESMR